MENTQPKKEKDTSNLCPKFEDAMALLGKRWIGLVVTQLLSGKKRFTDIEKSLAISGRLLSERLKELEELEIVVRKVYPEVPVRIEYVLTQKGQELEKVIQSIAVWAGNWGDSRKKSS